MNKRIYCALAAALCICMAVCGCAKEAPVAAGQYEEGENSEAGEYEITHSCGSGHDNMRHGFDNVRLRKGRGYGRGHV